MELTVVGNISMDKVGSPDKLVETQGGAAVYTSLSASLVGANVSLVGRIGEDYRFSYLKNLKRSSINLSGVKVISNGKSTRFTIIHDKFRANYCDYEINVGEGLTPEDIPRNARKSRIVHICPNSPSLQMRFVEFLDTKISLDSISAEIYRQPHLFVHELLKRADFYFPNREEATMIYFYLKQNRVIAPSKAKEIADKIKHNHLMEIASYIQPHTGGILCLKCDEYGVIVVDDESVRHVGAIQENVVDPTGAGDSFAGAFLSKYIKTGDISLSAIYGNTAASFVITDYGINRMLKITGEDIDKRVKEQLEEGR